MQGPCSSRDIPWEGDSENAFEKSVLGSGATGHTVKSSTGTAPKALPQPRKLWRSFAIFDSVCESPGVPFEAADCCGL